MMPSLGLNSFMDALGEIRWSGFNFAPDGTIRPEGQTLPITGNEQLFAEIGTTYGGDGTTDFMVPDLRGRVLVNHGDGPGLTSRTIG